MIKLGQAATGLKWGIEYHQDWPVNLPKLLSEIKESTPFTDLAIFIMRDAQLRENVKNYIDALSVAIKERFSPQLAQFWIQRIEKEKVVARHILENPFSSVHQAFAEPAQGVSPPNQLDFLGKEELIGYIVYLQGLLDANQIEFDIPIERRNP